SVYAERTHQRDVLRGAPVVIARDVAGVAVVHEARRVREAVPDARARAVGERRPFDLIGGRRRPPEKRFGKLDRHSSITMCAGTVSIFRSMPRQESTRPPGGTRNPPATRKTTRGPSFASV